MNKRLSLFLLIISVGLLTALAAGPVFGQAADGLGKADAARQKHTDALMAKPGVVGVALGYNPGGQAAVTVYAEHRDVKGIPQKLDGVPVHVVVTGKLLALSPGTALGQAPTSFTTTDKWPRPVPIGVSTGHPDITACTIGARVTDGTNVYALSNNHCYADENLASIGDPAIQPGTYDGGSSPADDIGTLDDFEPIVFSTSANNVIDAAIVATTTALVGTSTPSDGYGTPKSTTVAATLNLKVQKYGRTTGLTEKAKISGINATVNIGYSTGTARFVNQIIVKPGNFIKGGDSGSLMVVKGGEDDRKPVGLLYAGSSAIAIANPIGPVLEKFGVTIDDGSGPAPLAITTTSLPEGTEDVAYSATLEATGGTPSYGWAITTGELPPGLSMNTSGEITGTPTATNTYNFTVEVTDDGATDQQALSITVNEADTTAPAISGTGSGNINGTSADITWTTDEASDSVVNYGTTTGLGSPASVGDLVTGHVVGLSNLTAETTYYFEVESTDSSGNITTDDDNGNPYTFTTAAPGADMYVSAIDMVYRARGRGELNTTITILSGDGAVSGANVNATLSRPPAPPGDNNPRSWNFPGVTNASGQVLFKLKFPISGIEYTMCVKSVTHDNYDFDPDYDTHLDPGPCWSLPIDP